MDFYGLPRRAPRIGSLLQRWSSAVGAPSPTLLIPPVSRRSRELNSLRRFRQGETHPYTRREARWRIHDIDSAAETLRPAPHEREAKSHSRSERIAIGGRRREQRCEYAVAQCGWNTDTGVRHFEPVILLVIPSPKCDFTLAVTGLG